MNTYEKLKAHLDKYMYKRGANKGMAPAESSRRGKTHFVVRYDHRGGAMCVRMYSTDLLTAYPDGRIVVDTGGWSESSTTKMNMNRAFSFVPFRIGLWGTKVFSKSQMVLYLSGKKYRYYNGMEISGEGELLSEPKPFLMHRIDRDESAALAEEVKASGFKDVFPVLHANVAVDAPIVAGTTRNLRRIITDADLSARWPDVVAAFKDGGLDYSSATRGYERRVLDKAQTWAAIMAECKQGMYRDVESDVLEL